MDESKKESTTSLNLIVEIVLGPCTDVLRQLLTKELTTLKIDKEFRSFLKKEYSCWEFKVEDMCKYIETKDFSDFNIRLLYASLRFICSISPHKNEWGNFPDEQDRSLSANIERIYSTYMEYIHYPSHHLKDSTFEREWTSIFQTVKELEKHLGSGTKHQDTLHQLKTRHKMTSKEDPRVSAKRGDIEKQHQIQMIELEKHLGTGTKLRTRHKITSEDDPLVSARIKDIQEKQQMKVIEVIGKLANSVLEEEYHKTESEMEAEGIKILELGTEHHIHKFKAKLNVTPLESYSEGSDEFQDRTENIASKELTELFKSFNVEFPVDPLDESFARGILQNHTLELVSAINSLSNGVVLTKDLSDCPPPSNRVMVSEKDVVYKGGQFQVVKKDAFPKRFLMFPRPNSTPVIMLITSKFLPVVKAKLMVYEKYKHTINASNIFLQHEYEEFDNVAKLVAFNHLRSFCTYIESIINAFTVEFYQIFTTHVDRPIAAKDIKGMCLKAFNESRRLQPLSSYNEGVARETRYFEEWVAFRIHKKLSGKGDLISTDAWRSIWNICEKTVGDLGVILSGLEEFLAKVLPPNQDREIGEWLKREDIMNKALEHKHPFMTKCIAGQKGDTIAMKIYLSREITKEAEEAFKENFKSLGLTDFEFINFEDAEEMPEEFEQIKSLENNAKAIDKSTETTLRTIIQSNAEKLYARYSNIIGIRTGRCVRDGIVGDPCIIFYCLDKNLIPLGERKLPETLEGWPCDLREDFIMLGQCTANCRNITADYPVLGCSIGMPSHSASGSVGFMYETTDDEVFQSGFLTASHVAVAECQKLHSENTFLSNHNFVQNDHSIVHPSFKDNRSVNHTVGYVVEAFFGTTQSEGLDIAVVQTCKSINGEREILEVYDEQRGIFKKKVMKTGRTTNQTYGHLMRTIESIPIEHPPFSGIHYHFGRLYVVENIPKECRFFMLGDSGSGVFVVEENQPDKVLGIAIAVSKNYRETYVCKIPTTLNNLTLQLVRYKEQT